MKVEVVIEEWMLSALCDLIDEHSKYRPFYTGAEQDFKTFCQRVDWEKPLTLSGVSWCE